MPFRFMFLALLMVVPFLTGCTLNKQNYQLVQYVEPQDPVPTYNPTENRGSSEKDNLAPDKDLDDASLKMAETLTVRLKELTGSLSENQPKCGSNDLVAQLNTYRILGRFSECASKAEFCVAGGDDSSATAFAGARCFEGLNNFEKAWQFYNLSIDSKFSNEDDFFARTLAAALFAFKTQYEAKVSDLLKKVASENYSEKLLYSYLEIVSLGKSENSELSQVQAFAEAQLEKSGMTLDIFSAQWMNYLSQIKRDSQATLDLASKVLAKVGNPEQLTQSLYNAFYRQKAPNFIFARRIYDAYLPYAHVRSFLPVEQNTYTYTELYQDVCKDHLTQGSDNEKLSLIKSDWLNGKINAEQAITSAQPLGEKTDVLAFIGGMKEVLALDNEATAAYWKAHQACPYYNRSHWGLSSIFRREKNKAYSDYPKNMKFYEDTLSALPSVPNELPYVINWSSLTAESRHRLWFASRIWIPYFESLSTSKAFTFIKHSFMLLSQSPNLADLKDQRISYNGDNRLWDDVRGAGGETVVADLGEVLEAPHGAYNLAGHEIAHQFHFTLLDEKLTQCLDALYEQAKNNQIFADPYSGTNVAEYFAQAVTYFLVPADSPKRFGLNRLWFEKNDPQILNFVEQVNSVSGDVAKLKCPLN